MLALAAAAGAGGWWLLRPKPIRTLSYSELERRAAASSRDPELYRELAHRSLYVLRPRDALKWLERARALDPYHAENANLEGMARAELRDDTRAMAAFREAIQLDPKAVAPHLNLGRLALARGALWLASSEFEAAIELAPEDPDALVLLGLALKERGFAINAKKHIRKALELDPDNPAAHSALGQVYADYGQPLEARVELQKAIDLGDDTPATRAYLGLAYAILPTKPEDAETAIRHLRHAEGVGERGAQLYYGLGLAYTTRRDYRAAEKAFTEGLKAAPGSEGMRYGLARVYLNTGREKLGRAMLETYSALIKARQLRESMKTRADSQPERAELRVQYADLLMEHRQFDEAAGEYVKALRQQPDNAAVYRKLARASQLAGRPDAAAEARIRAASLAEGREAAAGP